MRPDWQDAACRGMDPELFFAPEGERLRRATERREREAKRVCMRCPMRLECLKWALAKPESFGVWGGMSEDERKTERRHRRQLRAA